MIDPVSLDDLMLAAIAGAMVIVCGAMYAGLFALAKKLDRPAFMAGAYAGYAGLLASVVVLARTLNLDGAWQSVSAVMVVGYFVAPRLIWRLCTGTHESEADGHSRPAASAFTEGGASS